MIFKIIVVSLLLGAAIQLSKINENLALVIVKQDFAVDAAQTALFLAVDKKKVETEKKKAKQ